MHVLAICAGIGGIEIGIKLATGNAARTVAVIEREGYCASVLRARMQDGSLDDCPIWSDVKTFDPEPWRGRVDCITAGWPCQPFSAAGRRKGAEDPRHLWPYIADIIRVLRPRYVFGENVPGHLSLGFEQVCRELCEMGYGVEAGIFSAAEVGAPHLRKRLFVLGHLADASGITVHEQHRGRGRSRGQSEVQPARNGENRDVADANGTRCRAGECCKGGAIWHETRGSQPQRRGGDVVDANGQRCRQRLTQSSIQRGRHGPDGGGVQCDTDERAVERRLGLAASRPADLVDHLARGWPADWEDGVPRVAENQPHRVDRLRALGNAVVPQTAALAWTTLMQQANAHGTPHL